MDHPVISFNNTPVTKVDKHKHFWDRFGFKAYFSHSYKTRKGIGLLKCLSKYLPKHMNELFKFNVRPNLVYGD